MGVLESRLFVVTRDADARHVLSVTDADIAAFCKDVYRNMWLNDTCDYYQFSLGFCACLDALASGTVDFDMPGGTVLTAYDDVNDVTVRNYEITDSWAAFLEEVGSR